MVLKRLLFRTFTTTVNTKKNNTSFCHWCCYRKYTAYYFYRIYPYFHLNKKSQFFYYPLWSCTKWEASDMLFGATICCMHKKLLPQSTGFWERNVLNLFSPCTWIYAPLLLFAALPVARELQLNINKQLWNLATNQNKVKTSKLLYLQCISDLLFEFHLSFPDTPF